MVVTARCDAGRARALQGRGELRDQPQRTRSRPPNSTRHTRRTTARPAERPRVSSSLQAVRDRNPARAEPHRCAGSVWFPWPREVVRTT
ncbi:hypothetical protein FNH04_17365 [Streptomyces phyllanthi]|uniref:Uncharacterized protein n=1 Tax=Streptomyces phyllanthi TaxID=1803180 RepID=A0A5N8W2W3_9ACTN|nr:hypothetical protein [Streptomyces phyllanthi]